MKKIRTILLVALSLSTLLTPAVCQALNLRVTTIDGGNSQTLALREDGTVWAYGENGSGQLGDGTDVDKTIPVRSPSLTGIVSLATGPYHTARSGPGVPTGRTSWETAPPRRGSPPFR